MSRWLRLWLILALALVVGVVYWPSTRVLGEQWADFVNLAYTHGWLILAVCVALLLRSRREIAAADTHLDPRALLALAGCILCWLVCYRASIQDLHVTIYPAIFWLAVTAAFGGSVGRLLLFPVAFLYLAVPSWSQLAVPLQALTVAAMQGVLRLTGPQALIHGDLIHIPNGTFEIEEGCSGLHFMTVGLAVAALHGELRRDPWRIRLRQLTLMAVLALLANWVRVYTVIEVGYLTDMHSRLLRNHYWFGWGVFAAALFVFFWLAARYEPAAETEAAFPSAQSQPTVAAARSLELRGFAVAVLMLVVLPAASAALRLMRPAAPLSVTTDPGGSWAPALLDIHSSWQPLYPGAAQLRRLAFADASGRTVEVFAVTYRTQRQGAKVTGMGTSLVGAQLMLGSERIVNEPWGEFRESEVADRTAPHNLYLIWSRYETGGKVFASAFPAQLWYGVNALVSNPSASLVAFRTACRPDCAAARRTLEEFAASAPTL